MNKNSMARLSPVTKKEIKKHKCFPNESYDMILQRMLGVKQNSKKFKLKKGKK